MPNAYDAGAVRPGADGYSYAVDLYPYINGSVRLDNIPALKTIAGHIKVVARANNIDVQWGGDWKMRDYAHFELFV